MPVISCERDGKPGWKWGPNGTCFIGPDARQKAINIGQALKAQETENIGLFGGATAKSGRGVATTRDFRQGRKTTAKPRPKPQ